VTVAGPAIMLKETGKLEVAVALIRKGESVVNLSGIA